MMIQMAKAIMIQGTASNAGKSLIAAGLCRILRQDGYRVAPFKSQNMALNSFITREGLEMGRAQVVQAEAAGIEPDVAMNPILLKPQSDTGSQVIVDGEVWGVMPAQEYYRRKTELVPRIKRAYEKLEAEYDVIVLEGAGSPAEINLREHDIVNMGMAKMAGAPVLLCGDIDRGGVFASLYGTLLLLKEDERSLVKGLLINKFRGDRAILEPGLRMLEARAGVPVQGVIPYLQVDIDDEDSLSERFSRGKAGAIDIAVIRLPRISNFTDFNLLSSLPGVSVRYLSSPREFGSPDILFLPGSKNTMDDLLWLRQCGLEAQIKKYAAAGGIVFGICGGYQMLGRTLRDPQGIEHGGALAGMGLLPVETVFTGEKTRTRASGRFLPLPGALADLGGKEVEGYEIHMGETTLLADGALCEISLLGQEQKKPDGCCRGNVYGSYLHGIFDSAQAIEALIGCLCARKGLQGGDFADFDPQRYRQRQYDLLAQGIRENVRMDEIYRIIEAGI